MPIYNKYESGLEFLTITCLKEAGSEDWLHVETELRKLSFTLLKKDKIAFTLVKKRIEKLQKNIIWPNDFKKVLIDLIYSFDETDFSLTFKKLKTILNKYFLSLPHPKYWDYEELIKRLEKILKYVREKDFKVRFQKILNLIDNHQWPSKLRYEIEDIMNISHSSELYQIIVNIIKKLKQSMPVPAF